MTSSNKDKQYCIACVWWIVCLGICILFFAAGLALFSIETSENTILLSPHDTRMLPIDQETCGNLRISTVSQYYTVNLYLFLDFPDKEYDSQIISIQKIIPVLSHSSTNYYLLNGSEIETTYRVIRNTNDKYDNTVIAFYVATSFEFMTNYPSFRFTPEYSHFCRNFPCHTSFTIQHDDEYYFIYHAQQTENTNPFGNLYAKLDITRSLFVVNNTDIQYSKCTAPCSIDIPSHPSLHVVIESNLPYYNDPHSWTDKFEIQWICTGVYSSVARIMVIIGCCLCLITCSLFPSVFYLIYLIKVNKPQQNLIQTNSGIVTVTPTAPPIEHYNVTTVPQHPATPVHTYALPYSSYNSPHENNNNIAGYVGNNSRLPGRTDSVLQELLSQDEMLPPTYDVAMNIKTDT